jgi:hypothetical protein
MRVLDTATILAAMAQVSPRERRAAVPTAPPAPAPEPIAASAIRVASVRAPVGRARACHRPTPAPPREPDEHGEVRVLRSTLVVVPQGVIPVMVASSRLAGAIRRFAVAS